MMDLLASFQRVFEQLPHRRLALGLTALLLALALLLLARISWLLLPRAPIPFAWQPQVVATGKKEQGLGDARDVPLFGQLVVASQPVVRATVDAPKTTLNLKLTGIVASDPQIRGAAIIEHQGKQATYGIGDQVDGTTATLRQILRDRVIIMNRGVEETLMLDGEEYRRAESSAAVSAPPDATPAALNQLGDMRRELRSNPGAAMSRLSDYLRVSPVRDGEGLQGWRINPGMDPQLFTSLGLQPNDLAIAMNGVDLTDLQQAMGIINKLGEMDQVALTVVRDGQQYDINFALPEPGAGGDVEGDPDIAPAYEPDAVVVEEVPPEVVVEEPYE
ncbi:MAG: type II secretion system protein GspC [Corallincola sp.]|nr:type II secretion system protein GspC [Corallincola sp.]